MLIDVWTLGLDYNTHTHRQNKKECLARYFVLYPYTFMLCFRSHLCNMQGCVLFLVVLHVVICAPRIWQRDLNPQLLVFVRLWKSLVIVIINLLEEVYPSSCTVFFVPSTTCLLFKMLLYSIMHSIGCYGMAVVPCFFRSISTQFFGRWVAGTFCANKAIAGSPREAFKSSQALGRPQQPFESYPRFVWSVSCCLLFTGMTCKP